MTFILYGDLHKGPFKDHKIRTARCNKALRSHKTLHRRDCRAFRRRVQRTDRIIVLWGVYLSAEMRRDTASAQAALPEADGLAGCVGKAHIDWRERFGLGDLDQRFSCQFEHGDEIDHNDRYAASDVE